MIDVRQRTKCIPSTDKLADVNSRAYALVLSGNHVYTSGAGGTHAATIRGALRAERPDLLTVVLPQSMSKQTKESQELLQKVKDVIAMPQNDEMSLDVASRICNSYLLQLSDQLISFAFHESSTVIEASKEAKKLNMLVTVLFLD
jgi:protein subunit release factor B